MTPMIIAAIPNSPPIKNMPDSVAKIPSISEAIAVVLGTGVPASDGAGGTTGADAGTDLNCLIHNDSFSH